MTKPQLYLTALFSLFFSACGGSGGTPNNPPIAVAKADRSNVLEGETIVLNGSSSTDNDSDLLSYQWTYEYADQEYTLTGISPNMITPEITQESLSLEILLTVSDNNSAISTDTIDITINNLVTNENTSSLVNKCLRNSIVRAPSEINGSYLTQISHFSCAIDHPISLNQLEINEFSKFINLETLSIFYHDFSSTERGINITETFPELSSLNKLKELTLDHVDFLESNNVISLTKLEKLDLTESSIGYEISDFMNLKKISLNNVTSTNTITIKQLENLESISIINTEIEDITDLNDKLTQLTLNDVIIRNSLDFTSARNLNKLSIIHSGRTGSERPVDIVGISNLYKLENLTLIYSNYSNPNAINLANKININNLNELKMLTVMGNRLAVNSDFSNLTQLVLLSLSSTELNQIKGLENLTNLVELRLADNTFDAIPNLISLKKLEILSFYHSTLRSYPDVSNLPLMKTAYFSYNKIMNIDNILKPPESTELLISLELFCIDNNLDLDLINSLSWLRAVYSELFSPFTDPQECI